MAEFERDLILQRTNEGHVRALIGGIRFGRNPKLTKHQTREALKRAEAGETLREIALSYNVDHSTISRLKTRYAAEASLIPPGGCFFGVKVSRRERG